MSAKIGRPTECKKEHDVKVRIDSLTHERLLNYCEAHGITKAEAIRRGIHLVLQEK